MIVFFIYQAMNVGYFCPIPKCLMTHLSYHWFFFVNGAPRALKAKTNKSDQSGERETTLLEVLHSCLMSIGTDGRVGA